MFWCTDAHTIYDENENIVNAGKFVEIGDHVWVGKDVKIGKNTRICSGKGAKGKYSLGSAL